MTFQINDRVVYPAFGVGRIVGLVTKSFFEDESRLYYEVSGERSTAWVQVDEGAARGLRRLTRKDELFQHRDILRGPPISLSPDHRQRQLDLRSQLRRGRLQDLCEVVRDLSARGWHKPLNESDSFALEKGRGGLCQEWAATTGATLAEANVEVNALLREARQSYSA
jgi:RNA polymerase-interacting CarD/CdnL/TRCF family regulator